MQSLDLALATRMLNPMPLLLLSTRSMQKANLMPLSRYCVVSQYPPRVAISIAPSRYSRRLIEQSGDFILSVPDVTMLEEVHFCGLYSGRSMDKFRVRELPTTRARMTSPLLVTSCVGHLECELVQRMRFGDHWTYVAEVVCALVDGEYWENHWRPDAHLLWHVGGDRYLVGERLIRPQMTLEPRHAMDQPPELDDPWKARPPIFRARDDEAELSEEEW